MKIVVIGNGMAATRFVERLVELKSSAEVLILGAEPEAAYNRILLSAVVEGSHQIERLGLKAATWYADHGIELRLDARVLSIDPAHKTVQIGTEQTSYDVLVLATGSIPSLPPIRGLVTETGQLHSKVHAFRTLADTTRLLAALQSVQQAVVLGGGLLGLQVARALAIRGIATEIVEGGEYLMHQYLPPAGAELLASELQKLGTQVYTGSRGIGFSDAGLKLDNGYVLSADLLVVTAGSRPATMLARNAGLAVGRGVLVDEKLATSDPNIYAIGDCAERAGITTGFVAPAWEQASVLAELLQGLPAYYSGSRVVARLRATGLDVAVLGDPVKATGQAIELANPLLGSYRQVVVGDQQVKAAAMVGDLTKFGTFTQLYELETKLAPAEVGQMLLPEPTADLELPDTAEVCACAGVTAGEIRGCASLQIVQESTRATTGCGGCLATVTDLLSCVTGKEN